MANPFRTQSKNPFRQGEITAQPATQESMDAWRDKVMGTAGMDAIGRALVTKAQSAFGNAGGDTARAVYQAPATFARGVGGGLVAANAGINQMLRDYTPLGAVPGLGDWLQGASNQGAKDAANFQAAATANYQTDIGRDVGGAINSLGATAPLTAGAIVAKNPAIMYGGMGAQTGLTEYGNARQAGLKPLEALPYAATQAEIEMLTEMMPAGALVDAFKTKNPVANLIKSPLKYGVGEMAGEQLATLGQDFAQGAYIYSRTNPNWVQDYKDGRLDAARSTAVASLVMAPGNVGIATTAHAAKEAVQGLKRVEGKNPFRQAATNPQPNQQRLAAALNMPTNPNATQNAIDTVRAAMVNGGMKTRADIPQVHGNQAVANFVNKTIGVESGGNPNAKNRKSSATGLGQFIESTWLDMMRRHRPDLVQGKGRAEILALRANPAISREMTTRYTEDNANALRKAGLPVTEGNLYLAHFSGAGTAAKALKANPNAPASSVYGQAAIDANGSILRGKTVGQVVAWANQKMGGKAQTTLPANQSMLSDGLNDGLMSDNLQPQYAPEDNGAQAEALNEIQRATREQRQAVEEMQDAARKAGKQTKVYLGEQMRNAHLQMLEADDLQPTLADAANQYRDRNRAASQVQVNRIAQNLQPELLGDSMQADTGAPTLAKDGKTIIGGNGRVMGIAQAYAQGSGQSYKQYLIDNAEQFGLNPAEVAAMDKPVLIRRLDDDVDIAKAAVASNEGGGLGMSALEQARVDADRLPDFGTFLPGDNGELNTPANRGFIRKFVGQMPTTVQAQMVDAQGMLSQDGIRRLHNAMLHRAYGNSPALSRMVESTDQGARNMVSAMMQAAPTIAKARDHIKSGAMHDADIAADIVSAVEKLNQLRESGSSTADYLAQQGMFEDDLSPVARDLLQFLDEHKRSAKAIATLLRNYYDLLGAQGSPNQADVFGDNTAPDKQQLLRKAANDYEQQNGTAEQNELFGNSETFRRPQEPDRQTGQQPESRRGDEAGAGEDTGGAEKQQDGLKFSSGDNHHNSKSAYEAAKAARKTELTFHQWQQVRTPEFKAWFGDWESDPDNASKVVNPRTGEPMVVYHGTTADIEAFDLSRAGEFGERFADAAFFTSNPEVAAGYAQRLDAEHNRLAGIEDELWSAYGKAVVEQFAATKTTNGELTEDIKRQYDDAVAARLARRKSLFTNELPTDGANIIPVFLRSATPVEVDAAGGFFFNTHERAFAEAENNGSDSVIVRNVVDRSNEFADGVSDVFAVFDPTQIKSATGNSGAFDAGNNDIRFSRGATLGDKKKSDPADFNEALQQAGGFAAYDKAIAAGKTKLTLREWVWVRTPQFKRWFGDWENDPANASKIIDRETGEPKPVYHNSGEQLTEFDLEFVRTSDEIQAHFFAPESDPYKEYGEYEHIVFLNIRNPADAQTAYAGFGEKRVKRDAGIRQREELISKGYDGVVVEEDGEVVEYMAFHANQIKSATTQNGDFSPDNNDIRYSRSEDTKRASPEQIKQTRQAIEQAVGKQNMRHIEIVAREEVARPDNAEDLRDAQGWYDPKTQRITLIAEALPNQRTAQFVAWHELGHRKIDVDGWNNWQALFRTAYNGNPVIKQVADNIFKARKGAADGAALNKFLAVEEAVADLYAAHKTGDYAAFEQRNGVKVPQAMRNTLGGYFARLANHLRTVLAKVMGVQRNTISDADIYGWLQKLDKADGKTSGSLNDDAKFSRQPKIDNSKSAYESAKAAGETELTFHQWQQVRTHEFKAWFGDWENDPDNASKVINPKTGEPLVVYHGTTYDFSVFSGELLGKKTNAKSAKKGFFFAASPRSAQEYATTTDTDIIPSRYFKDNPFDRLKSKTPDHYRESITDFYKREEAESAAINENLLSAIIGKGWSAEVDRGKAAVEMRKYDDDIASDIEKGVSYKEILYKFYGKTLGTYSDKDNYTRIAKEVSSTHANFRVTASGFGSPNVMPVFLNMRSSSNTNINGAPDFGRLLNGALTRAVNTGKDGVVARDIIDGGGMTTHYVVFRPNQIKSATGNSGAFDAGNDDIRYSRGEALSPQEKRFFNEIGELEVGVKAYNKLAGLLKPAFAKIRMANTAPEQFTQMMRDYRAQLNVAGRTVKTVADAGVKMTEAERKLLSDVLEKELPHGVEVSPELQELAATIREILTQQSDDLVALEMLSEASRERFKDTYLPRLYAKHMTGDTALDALNKELGKAMRGALGNAVKGQHLKGRGLFKEVKRGEQAKYEAEGWEMRHDYGNKGKKAGVVVMWRDYTREERASMGEERDAMMRFTSGYIKTQSDIAKGMLFKRIAEDGEMTSDTAVEGWTHVPDTEIAGTGGVKRYGALAGKWVHPEVAYHLQQQFYIDNAVQKVWRAILGFWKLGKTVLNAVAHVNNFISNIVMTFSAGGKLRDIVPMALEIKRKGALYNEALEHGLIGEAVDVAGLQEMFVGLNNVSDDKLLDGLIMRTLKRADKLALNLPSKAAKAAQKAYRVEDEVFKLVLYKRGKEAGLSPQEAADYALTFMFDYSEVPQGVKWLRDTGILPFVSYTYKAMPAMARLALTRPHRALMVTGFLYGINALSYALLGGAADEDEEREYMPDYQKGYTVFGTPKLIRLPWNDSKGKPIFIDVYRWLPLGDFADTQNQMGGLPLPQWATPNGPVISHAFALIGNKDTFTGRDIVKPYQSGGEKAATYGKWLAAQWLPASVGVPFSYHTNNVLEGAKSQFEGTKMADALEWMGYTGTTYRGEDKQLYRSLPGAFGVKLRGEKPEDMKAARQRQIGYEMREVKADMSRIRRDNTLTDAAKQARLEKRREALERLYEKRPD